MIVFRTFLKVLNKCKVPILLYTVLLIGFSGFNMTTSENPTNFTATKPNILILSEDEEKGITKSFISYMKENSNWIELDNEEEKISDALFYRDVNYVIYIPKNYREDFLAGKDPKLKVKSTKDYPASLAELMLKRYQKVAKIYQKNSESEEEIIQGIETTLSKEVQTEMTSKQDTSKLTKATFYYNFANYCILAGAIYVICLILSSFKKEGIQKRTVISSMNYKEYNRKLLFSNCLLALLLWLFYIILSIILLGNIMFTGYGLCYILNSFVFTFCALTIAFLLGNLVRNKEAINGIVNCIALGSSFLCGAFVPMEWLPDAVLKIAHILPSYWYIKTNELVKNIEVFQWNTLKPIISNMVVLLLFSVFFILLTNWISKKKRHLEDH